MLSKFQNEEFTKDFIIIKFCFKLILLQEKNDIVIPDYIEYSHFNIM